MKYNKNFGFHSLRRVFIGLGLALIIAGICMPANLNAAEGKVRGEWKLPDYYPYGFDGYGYLNRIAFDELVVDDSLHRVSPSVTFATPDSAVATSADFAEGDLVGYVTDSERVIISLWLIKKGGS